MLCRVRVEQCLVNIIYNWLVKQIDVVDSANNATCVRAPPVFTVCRPQVDEIQSGRQLFVTRLIMSSSEMGYDLVLSLFNQIKTTIKQYYFRHHIYDCIDNSRGNCLI